MCLAVVALDAHPRYPLVIAANRDEYHARPRRAPHGGTTTRSRRPRPRRRRHLARRAPRGRWALLTNVREAPRRDPDAPSRGELVPHVLRAAPPRPRRCAARRRATARHNGFNLLAGTLTDAAPGRRIAPPAAARSRRRARPVQRGARHAVAQGRRAPLDARGALASATRADGVEPLFDMLADSRGRRGRRNCRRPASRSTGSARSRARSSSATPTAPAARRWSRSTATAARVSSSAPSTLRGAACGRDRRALRIALISAAAAASRGAAMPASSNSRRWREAVARVERQRLRLRVQHDAGSPRRRASSTRRSSNAAPDAAPAPRRAAPPSARCARPAAGAPQPIGVPAASMASAWRQLPSMPSHSSSSGTRCSTTNTS